MRRRTIHIRTFAPLGLLMSATVAMPAFAQQQDVTEENAAVRALNVEQARLAAKQIADYEAEKQAVADEQAAKMRVYHDALATRDAQIAAVRKQAADERLRWEAAVTACLAGDQSRCVQPVPVAK